MQHELGVWLYSSAFSHAMCTCWSRLVFHFWWVGALWKTNLFGKSSTFPKGCYGVSQNIPHQFMNNLEFWSSIHSNLQNTQKNKRAFQLKFYISQKIYFLLQYQSVAKGVFHGHSFHSLSVSLLWGWGRVVWCVFEWVSSTNGTSKKGFFYQCFSWVK